MTFGFFFIALLITTATLYLRKFVAAKAEKLGAKAGSKRSHNDRRAREVSV
jgi:hypothetical protein